MAACRSALAVLVAHVLLGTPLLPVQHLHRAGIEGRTEAIVHAHGPGVPAAGACRTAFSSDHGDHGRALFLTGDFTRPWAAPVAAPPAASVIIASPEPDTGAVVAASDAPLIHGPPLLVPVTRGPPSLS
jgi:hypothetical protein